MKHPSQPEGAADAATASAARAEALRYNFISCLILAAQNGFGRDVDHLAALCRETCSEHQWWDAVKDLPHGRVRQEGPALEDADEPFGCERGPFSAERTHLMYAAQAGDVARLTWLLARGARLELKDWMGRTALYWAAREGRVGAVQELLARGAAVDAATTINGWTSLLAAIAEGHLEVVRELLARGAAVNAALNSGGTPLIIASGKGHLEVVRELLVRGAAVDAATNDGWTPLHITCHGGHLEVVRELLARGARPGLAANDGTTATANGHAAIAQLLRAASSAAP